MQYTMAAVRLCAGIISAVSLSINFTRVQEYSSHLEVGHSDKLCIRIFSIHLSRVIVLSGQSFVLPLSHQRSFQFHCQGSNGRPEDYWVINFSQVCHKSWGRQLACSIRSCDVTDYRGECHGECGVNRVLQTLWSMGQSLTNSVVYGTESYKLRDQWERVLQTLWSMGESLTNSVINGSESYELCDQWDRVLQTLWSMGQSLTNSVINGRESYKHVINLTESYELCVHWERVLQTLRSMGQSLTNSVINGRESYKLCDQLDRVLQTLWSMGESLTNSVINLRESYKLCDQWVRVLQILWSLINAPVCRVFGDCIQLSYVFSVCIL